MRYQVGGSLRGDDPIYVVRQADEQLYTGLKAGDFCYVLNSRQMGKSSLLQRTSQRLELEGYSCVYIDVTRLGSEETTPKQWYKGIIISLFYQLNLAEQVNFKEWWDGVAEFSFVQRLHQFVEQVLLPKVQSERILIFIDEIDSLLSLRFPVNDFFAWIRHCYNQRTQNSDFARLGFALFGVASPSDLITDKLRTPFNIGRAISLSGFQLQEATPLLKGLEGVVSQNEVVLQEIIHWTGGQPFLTQKLCQLVRQTALETATGRISLPPGTEGFWVERLVRSRQIQHWESQDEPEHLRTIRDRLLFDKQRAGRLLGLYQRMLQAERTGNRKGYTSSPSVLLTPSDSVIRSSDCDPETPVPTDDSQEQTELLLSGLVEKRGGYLRIKNPIYHSVFNWEWTAKQLDDLRPYSQSLNAWVASGYQDESRLLRGIALRDALHWAQGKSLSDLDYQFLAASQEGAQLEVQRALEATRAKEVEARLAQEKKTATLQRFLLVAVGIGLLISTTLGMRIFIQYRQVVKSEYQARSSEIRALVSSSEGLFASNRRLDALIEAIKAKQRLQKLGEANTDISRQVENVLQQTVYGVDEYNRLSGHKASVMAVDISPDSSLIASASVDKTVKLWKRDGTEFATLKGHQAIVRAVKFSPDNQFIASGGDDGTVKLWKRNGTLLKTFQGHTAGVWGVAFSPDGQTIASASGDKTVKLWRRDGRLLRNLQGHTAGVGSVAFSPDGQMNASASGDKTVKLWRRDGRLLRNLQGHTSVVAAVAFSPDGQMIASASGDKTVKLWRRDGSLLRTLEGHTAVVSAVAFSPDGQTVVSAGRDKIVKLWHIDGTELTTLRGHSASIWAVAVSRDGSFIASAGAENTVRLWQQENPFQTTITAHQAGIWGIDISSDSSKIATGSEDGTTKLWSRGGKLLMTFTGGSVPIYAVALSRDGKLTASARNDSSVKLWKRDGTLITNFVGHSSTVFGVALSPDGHMLASGSQDNTVKLWQANGTLLKTLTGHHSPVWQVVFSPDSQFIASAGGDGTVKLWQADGTLRRTLKGHTVVVWRVAFSPNGQIIASGSGDNTVKLWKLDGSSLRTLEGHTAGVWGVAFSPDGQTIASGSVDTTIKLWKLDGTSLRTLRGHTAAIRGLAISCDGTTLASVGEDNKLILWNLPRILNLDVLAYGCDRVRNYLRTNQEVQQRDTPKSTLLHRHLCDGIGNR
jgi:WD40 repeat protein